MPIYMDRHDVSDKITAEHIAELHQEDLKVQDRFCCRGLTYWFDEKRKTAFCLIEAPDSSAIVKMHDEAHGQVPHRVIEVDAAIVESFLGRIEDPKKAQDTTLNVINDPGFRTIMIFSLQDLPFIGHDPDPFRASLHAHHHAVLNLVNDHEGKPVRQTENYVLASFRSVSDAVRAAIDIRSLFSKFKKEVNNKKIVLKIGLSTGVPVTEKKLIFEDAVKLAERMCKLVKGEIIVSPEVRELYDEENLDPLKEKNGLLALTREDERFLSRLMDHIESIWSDTNFKIDDLSRPTGCSKSQLYRKMILLSGKSPNAFIREYRLQEALALLGKKGGNISEVAFETGFSSPSYFSKCFFKQYGYQPSDHLTARVR